MRALGCERIVGEFVASSSRGVRRLALAAAGRVADAGRVPGGDTAVCAQELSARTCARTLLLTPPCPCLSALLRLCPGAHTG